VIRRGPTGQVATLLWNRETDEFTMGQWLKGRIYERRCDLSPDGKFLIYFAAKRGRGEGSGTWTAISYAPYLKALAFFPQGDTYGGGGLWLTSNSYWLNTGHKVSTGADMFWRDESYQPQNFGNMECLGVYYPRLLRDGWKLVRDLPFANGCRATVFEKDLRHEWTLRKIAWAESPKEAGRGVYWDEHLLVHRRTDTVIKLPKWEWAESVGSDLIWAQEGKLMRAQVGEGGLEPEQLIRDFNDMKFEPIQAPYPVDLDEAREGTEGMASFLAERYE